MLSTNKLREVCLEGNPRRAKTSSFGILFLFFEIDSCLTPRKEYTLKAKFDTRTLCTVLHNNYTQEMLFWVDYITELIVNRNLCKDFEY